MSQFRFVALLLIGGAAGCYREASEPSTIPTTPFADEPHYISGPPGGAMDPEARSDAYAAPADPGDPAADNDDDEDADPVDVTGAPAPGEPAIAGPAEQAPELGDEPGAAVAGPIDPGQPAVDATAGVTDVEITATLEGYGQWIETEDYGEVWRPDATVVGVDFTPYESGGSWAYTDAGWAFSADYSWGWLPFHYGRWAWFHDYWGWVPGHRWGPAWVDWRHGGGVVGWRPRPPRVHHGVRHGHRYGNGNAIRDHRRAELHDAHWRFATEQGLGRPHIRSHLYGNPAEGLRVTSRVRTPPTRARTMIHASDVMRDRGRPRTDRWRQPPQRGGSLPRDYQRGPSYNQSYRSPVRVIQQPQRNYPPPQRGYQQPVRVIQQPQRNYQPPQRGYPQPQRGGYQPPVRVISPSPGRVWSSPSRPSAPPPQRTWSGPSRPSAPSAPTRSWSPPSHGGGSHTPSNGGSHTPSNGGSHTPSNGGSHGGSHGGGSRGR